jgi:hypothetical protein
MGSLRKSHRPGRVASRAGDDLRVPVRLGAPGELQAVRPPAFRDFEAGQGVAATKWVRSARRTLGVEAVRGPAFAPCGGFAPASCRCATRTPKTVYGPPEKRDGGVGMPGNSRSVRRTSADDFKTGQGVTATKGVRSEERTDLGRAGPRAGDGLPESELRERIGAPGKSRTVRSIVLRDFEAG